MDERETQAIELLKGIIETARHYLDLAEEQLTADPPDPRASVNLLVLLGTTLRAPDPPAVGDTNG